MEFNSENITDQLLYSWSATDKFFAPILVEHNYAPLTFYLSYKELPVIFSLRKIFSTHAEQDNLLENFKLIIALTKGNISGLPRQSNILDPAIKMVEYAIQHQKNLYLYIPIIEEPGLSKKEKALNTKYSECFTLKRSTSENKTVTSTRKIHNNPIILGNFIKVYNETQKNVSSVLSIDDFEFILNGEILKNKCTKCELSSKLLRGLCIYKPYTNLECCRLLNTERKTTTTKKQTTKMFKTSELDALEDVL